VEHFSVPILVVLGIAVLAPLIQQLPLPLRLPGVVLEIALGVVVGPHALGWLQPLDPVVSALAGLGLAFLFFMAGAETDFERLRGQPLRLGVMGWLLSFVLGIGFAAALGALGLVRDSWLVGIALTTTAIGTLLPILRDAGELQGDFGRFVLAAGALGELGPIVALALLPIEEGSTVSRISVLAGFGALTIGAVATAMRTRPPRAVEMLARTLHSASQLPVRIALFLLGTLVVLAQWLGLDVVLGAFSAGLILGVASRGPEAAPFRHKLDAVGFGFLIPIFFVVSGATIDLPALASSTDAILRVPLFLALFLLVRGLPALLLYREGLGARDRSALALYSSTGLPLVVAIAEIGKHTGRMLPENAAALVGAGVLSVLLLPMLAMRMRRAARREALARSG
jgi:Kef-type K+ transport system membrane component KefB